VKQRRTSRLAEGQPEKQAKAEIIRDAIRSNPDGAPNDIMASIKQLHGFEVAKSVFYNARKQVNGGLTRKQLGKRAAVAANAAPVAGGSDQLFSLTELRTTSDFIRKLGGPARAQKLVALMTGLR
jgi:hypothetical protein